MRLVLCIALFTIGPLLSFAQKDRIGFNLKDFNEKFDVALWLFEYDAIAWWTTDSVMTHDSAVLEKLGEEWFCFKSETGTWHALYGKLYGDHYDAIFHYMVNKEGKIKRSKNNPDSLMMLGYARALHTANEDIQPLKDTAQIRFNQFVRINDDETFDVWLLPAFQPDGSAVYGGEFHFNIDHTGKIILSRDFYYQGAFRGFKTDTPREIWLNYRDLKEPSLGSIFFAWYYKKYFTSIKIDNMESISTPFKGDDGFSWVHVVKDKQKSEGKRQKKKRKE